MDFPPDRPGLCEVLEYLWAQLLAAPRVAGVFAQRTTRWSFAPRYFKKRKVAPGALDSPQPDRDGRWSRSKGDGQLNEARFPAQPNEISRWYHWRPTRWYAWIVWLYVAALIGTALGTIAVWVYTGDIYLEIRL
jgi:hypothetical protein